MEAKVCHYLIRALVLTALTLGGMGCEKTAAEVDEAASEVADGVEETADELDEAADDVADTIDDAVDHAEH